MPAMSSDDHYPKPGTPIHKLVLGCAAVILDDQKRVLLQRRSDNGYWGLPGGGVEPGERVTDTVVREVYEETGLRVEVVRLHGVYSDPALGQLIRYPDGNVGHIVALTFACRIVGGEIRVSDESTAVEWHPTDALPEPMTPSHRVRLADFLKSDGQVVVR